MPHADKFGHKIFNYVKHDQSDITIGGLEHMMQEYFRTFGFLDCMQLEICKPGSGPINSNDERNPEMWRLQRAFFTAYGKMWGMKCQGVFIPNVLLANIYITPIAQNDKGVINISGLEEELQRLLMPYRLSNGALPVLYGDNIYDPSTLIAKSNSVKNRFQFAYEFCSY